MGKRIGALAASLIVIGALAGSPARAETVVQKAETYVGSATATGLDISLLGNAATFGFTKVEGNSALDAVASGAGQLLVDGTSSEVKVAGVDQAADSGEKCAAAILPAEVTDAIGVDLAIACSQSAVSTAGGVPVAHSNASVAELNVSANLLLDTLGLGDPLDEATGEIIGALEPLFGQFDGTPVEGVVDTVSDLLDDVINTQTLRVAAGTSVSDVVATGDTITSTGLAQGAVIDVLPTGAIDPLTLEQSPVLTIEVGAAKATAVYDRTAGTSAADFDPALVRATLDKTVALGLGLNDGSEDFVIEVAPGVDQTIEVPGLGVLARIAVASGSTVTNPDGSVGAVADGVRVEVLPGVSGGVVLGLAHAEAGVAGSPAVIQDIVPVVELPRTGGSALLPVAGLGLLGLAAATRRFSRRAS
jgi:hypothetical protein